MTTPSPRILFLTLVTAFSASSAVLKAEILTPPDVTASATEFSAQYAATNVFDNDAPDFASQGLSADTFLEFEFSSPAAFDKIVVLNRDSPAPGDWIKDFTLTFDDGPSVSITREAARGVSQLHDTGAVTATKVRLDVDTTGGDGATNTGAMEIFFVKTPTGSVPVDSVGVTGSAQEFDPSYVAANAADGLVGRASGAALAPEYASRGLGVDAYVDFDFGAEIPVTGFDWFDRITAADRVTAFDMILSKNAVFGDADDVVVSVDNSTLRIGASSTFQPVTARYARYDVTAVNGAANVNAGVSEIVFYKSSGGAAVAPQVVSPPANATKLALESHRFTFTVTGSAPLTYQWNKNGQPIQGANAADLILTNLQASDDADYTVTVSNTAGSVISAAGHLAVDVTPGNPAAGRLVWLKLDETAGLNAADSAGGDNPGLLENFAEDHSQWQPGRAGGALRFNPNGPEGNVVTVADTGALDFSTSGVFSASCWVKAPANVPQVGGAAILCKGTGGGGEQFCLDVFGGGYRFYTFGASVPPNVAIINTAILPNGEWQHLAIVLDRAADRMQLWVNGELAGTANPGDTTISTSDPIVVGSRKPNALPETTYDLGFQGLIDEVSVYGRILTPLDVQAVSPFIKIPPLAATAFGGETHTFSVTGAGAQPITYQWNKNGTALPGATGATLALASLGAGDAGDYSVTLTNAAGTITSTPVHLDVSEAPPDVTRGLLAHLKLDETSGFTAADSSGANHPGTLEGFGDDNAQWQAGNTGGALAFSASNPDSTEVVNIPDTGEFDFTATGAFSASAWVKATPGATQEPGAGVLCKGVGNGGEVFCLDTQPAGYRFYVWNGGNPNTPTVLQSSVTPSGEWQYVAIVFNLESRRMEMYVDGVRAGAVAPPTTLLFNADPISIGARIPDSNTAEYSLNFQGLIDDVRIHNRDLSPTEIALLGAVAPPVDGPALTIMRNAGNLEISWPAGVTGWVLEESAALDTQVWTPTAGVVNNRLSLSAPVSGRKFYRLRQQ